MQWRCKKALKINHFFQEFETETRSLVVRWVSNGSSFTEVGPGNQKPAQYRLLKWPERKRKMSDNGDYGEEVSPVHNNVTYITMTANIGALWEYRITKDSQIHEERLEHYLSAYYNKADRRIAVWATVIGQEAYKVIEDLSDPVLPHE